MGNMSVMEQQKRREKVRDCWARGMRCLSKIAEVAGCTRITVKKDLVLMRRHAAKDPLTEEKLHLVREQIAMGYEKDIETLDELIAQARGDQREKQETESEVNASVASVVNDPSKATTEQKLSVTKKTVTTNGVDYHAVGLLIQRKLEARRKLAELYQLLEPETRKLMVHASASAHVSADINLQGIPDADLIGATKSIFDRAPSQN